MNIGKNLIESLRNGEFLECEKNRFSERSFGEKLKRCAIKDVNELWPIEVSSAEMIQSYYDILSANEHLLPAYMCETLPSNGQTRYRVANRNMFSSNAFHTDGLANQSNISAYKTYNDKRKGETVVFQGKHRAVALGDYLKCRLVNGDFMDCDENRNSSHSFWNILKETAVCELNLCYPRKYDSDNAIKRYYEVLSENTDCLPDYMCEVLPSNGQERYRVANRNMFSSNAFHPDGLANQKEVRAYRKNNDKRKGDKIVFQGRSSR